MACLRIIMMCIFQGWFMKLVLIIAFFLNFTQVLANETTKNDKDAVALANEIVKTINNLNQ